MDLSTQRGANMNTAPSAPAQELISFKEVCDLLGQKREYVRKLVTAKVLFVFQPVPNVRPLYYREQVMAMKRLAAADQFQPGQTRRLPGKTKP
jgi:hypothetical protein